VDPESAIREVLTRYARAVDRCDWETVLTCFEPEASLDYGQVRGSPADFVGFAREGLAPMVTTQHILHQSRVELDGENAANVETYVSAFHRMPDDRGGLVDLVAGARYVDRFSRVNAEWRISDRSMVYDWTRIDPVGAVLDDPTLVVGRRDREDPSWRWFGPAGR
jgi:3-phenylpropionate/cinnamic acid dioxygenase small subunit